MFWVYRGVMMRTFGAVLDEHRGIGPGFDFLRIFLAVLVLFTHSFLIAQGDIGQFGRPGLNVFQAAILPMFFALSGFLITGSALRLRLRDFLLNRAMRIVPALAVDIAFAALIIGPIFTSNSLEEYFSSYKFRAYFLNIIGVIHYTLLGVFETNPFPKTVNGSLWTVPYEIGCYVIMSSFILFGWLKRPLVTVIITAIVTAIIVGFITQNIEPATIGGLFRKDSPAFNFLNHYVGLRGLMLYISFMLGSVFFLFRRYIPKHWTIATACAISPITASFLFPSVSATNLCAIFAPALVYLTAYIGMLPIPAIPLYQRGDYSYGIYLYGYPFQQALVTLFPGLTSPWLHFSVSLVLATGVAMGSWHVIEKPILSLRKKYSFTARKGTDHEVLPGERKVAAPAASAV